MPTSKETRVRVELNSKTMASVRPLRRLVTLALAPHLLQNDAAPDDAVQFIDGEVGQGEKVPWRWTPWGFAGVNRAYQFEPRDASSMLIAPAMRSVARA